jgi:diguanylate cyclase (GGDEF)-like protein
MNKAAILCIDDDEMVTSALRTLLTNNFKEIQMIDIAQSADEAMEVLDEFEEDGVELKVVIVDYIMPNIRGDELLVKIHKRLPRTKKIMLTGQSDISGVKRAINDADLYRFIEKPWHNQDLLMTIKNAILAYDNEIRLEKQNLALKQMNEDLEIKVAERTKALEKLSITDQLTGMYNRLKLDQEFERELNRGNRYGTPFSIILLDLDKFKRVNDTFGHQAGDQTLKEIAGILTGYGRRADVTGRWGGEEFLIVCPESDLAGVLELAEIFRNKIETHDFSVIDQMTASFGVTTWQEGDKIQTMMERVDAALYQAKENGRNCVETK